MQAQRISSKENTALLKKYILQKYGMKVSVKSEHYAGGCSLNISYDLGVSARQMEAEFKDRLQEGTFNGMEDIYEYSPADQKGIVLDGKELLRWKYVFIRQEIGAGLWYRLAKAFSDMSNFADVPKLEKEDDFYTQFPTRLFNAWHWKDLVYQHFQNRNFITQDESKINIISCGWQEDYREIYFIYEVDGIWHNTKEFKINAPEIKKASRPEVNGIRVIDYSAKAIAVIGGTYEIKDQLKEAGGVFNRALTVDGAKVAGWIFPKSKQDQVSNIVIDYQLINE